MENIIVTGGAGFIGSELCRQLSKMDVSLTILDSLTYAGNLSSIESCMASANVSFVCADIGDSNKLFSIIQETRPTKIMHLAAESHVDRSIEGADDFIQTNIVGTFKLLEAARAYFETLDLDEKADFRFHHISTDEVYGDLENTTDLFTETTPYAPSSPYSASKAASDHLVRAWYRTYGLPTIITNCSNNYGPYHFPEKLIPHMILNALDGKPLPVYGDGGQVRDWLYVEDHARALIQVAQEGVVGETYNIGGNNEKTNLEVVHAICDLLEELHPDKPAGVNQYRDLIEHVKDRPGHDHRYAIDATKIQRELGWTPQETFESGLRKTVQWYLDNPEWWQSVLSGDYQLARLGTIEEGAA